MKLALSGPKPASTPPSLENGQDDADKINIVVELLGVEEQALRVSVQDSKVVIWTEDAALSYYEEIGLPAPVDAGTLISQYIIGVLSINLRKV